jgi:signal transduction histidine kinase
MSTVGPKYAPTSERHLAPPPAEHLATLVLNCEAVVTSFRGPGEPETGLNAALVGSALTDIHTIWSGPLEHARSQCLMPQAGHSHISLSPEHRIFGDVYPLDDDGNVVAILCTHGAAPAPDVMARVTDLGRWTRAFVHMLNNTLFGILGYAEFGLKHDDTKIAYNALTQVQTAGQRLRDRGNVLLTYARALDEAAGQAHCAPEHAARSALDLLDATGRDTQRLQLSPSPEAKTIAAPVSVIAQILANLLDNALDALGHGDEGVTLTITADEQAVTLVIQDTGCGMEASMLARAALPFVTTKASSATGHSAVGMGLTLATEMAKQVGATLTLVSEAGEGTTATLRCPTYQGALNA